MRENRSLPKEKRGDLCLGGVAVGSEFLASDTGDDVNETAVVEHALLGAAAGALLRFLLLDLRGLALDFTGTGQRAVDFAAATPKAERP